MSQHKKIYIEKNSHLKAFAAVLILGVLMFLGTNAQTTHAQSEFYPPQLTQTAVKGMVTEVVKEQLIQNEYAKYTYQELKIKLTQEPYLNQEIIVKINETPTSNSTRYEVGDKLNLLRVEDENSKISYYITDFDRTNAIVLIFFAFIICVLSVSRFWGLAAVIGMVYSFAIIFKLMLPQILNGHDPLLIAILSAFLIAPASFYLSHGINRKTTIALISTTIALIITGILSIIAINMSKLTGFGSEEAYFLQLAKHGEINIKGLLLAGIIIGTLGILDDVTVSQASIVTQLKHANKRLSQIELYKYAMRVGHDHITSTVNTLVLVYTGAAMPLLLLFINSEKSFTEVMSLEIIADEIIRTLVGSIGLILAVPITTFLAVKFADENDTSAERHSH
ncbi:YibE/F family protein [Candidatus Nomurabacteria bacterium]|uniref:YibE/F family protein n=1 Tax=candidate division WWE3 bacterium TaxID=2053526 RepID=A0A955E153_UNCKA|nr:YibE/F family protein [candidate division WWE3 bacterium]MCB9823413.1 YibE/F family protein [Candidatus Nomurabacteria bacterium]MCB9827695.1 YibE/F family protein [Candidatus Nomurabacteria bacterium]